MRFVRIDLKTNSATINGLNPKVFYCLSHICDQFDLKRLPSLVNMVNFWSVADAVNKLGIQVIEN